MFSRRKSVLHQGVLSQIDERKSKRGPRTARAVILAISFFIAGNVALAVSTTIPELARAPGEIVPAGQFHQVESAEAGVIRSVIVEEGAFVEGGDVLASLNSVQLDQLETDIDHERRTLTQSLAIQTGLLQAIEAGAAPSGGEGASIVEMRFDLFRSQQQIRADLITHLAANILALDGALELAQTQADSRRVPLERFETLFRDGLTTQDQVLAAQEKYDAAQSNILDIQLKLAQARQDHQAAISEQVSARLTLREELVLGIVELEGQLDGLDARAQTMAARRDSLEIRAPAAGYIQAVAFPNPGEFIEAGETVFEILPTNQQLVAQIEFQHIDIGHISVGDSVGLKFDTFDVRRYGQISGHIAAISPNSVFDQQTGQEFFRATVALDQMTVGTGVWEQDLRAGMRVTAELVTSERTVMSYLIKPIKRSLDNALWER